jgi:methyl-accepting chemotaxis protein
VQHASALIGEITAAASVQSSELGQVGDAVVQVDQMTQQNAALVEQSMAASHSLHDQTVRLQALVDRFTLAA